MNEYEVRDKYGNKIGEISEKPDDTAAAFGCVAVLVIAAAVFGVLMYPLGCLVMLFAMSAYYCIIPLAAASIYQGGKIKQEDPEFTWKLLFKLAWRCGWPACVAGVIWALCGGTVSIGGGTASIGGGTTIEGFLLVAEWTSIVSLGAAFLPAVIILYPRYREKRKK